MFSQPSSSAQNRARVQSEVDRASTEDVGRIGKTDLTKCCDVLSYSYALDCEAVYTPA